MELKFIIIISLAFYTSPNCGVQNVVPASTVCLVILILNSITE